MSSWTAALSLSLIHIFIGEDEKGRLSPLLRQAEHSGDIAVLMGGTDRHHTLVADARAQLRQLESVHPFDRDSSLLRQVNNLADTPCIGCLLYTSSFFTK